MSPIRILHASDLHLANSAQERSLFDQIEATKMAAKRALVADLKRALSSGIGDLPSTLSGLLDGESIQLLVEAFDRVDPSDIESRLNSAWDKILSSDSTLTEVAVEALRNIAIATSYDPGAIDCLCNFITDQEVNAIVITGDLATTGSRLDLEQAAKFFLETSEDDEFDLSIGRPDSQLFLLPGNHDRFVFTGKGFIFAPGGKEFDTIFGNHWSGPVQRYQVIRSEKEKLSVLIVAADFGLLSPDDCTLPLLAISRLAQGRIYPTILSELESATETAKNEERAAYKGHAIVTLWAIHFPPYFPYRQASRMGKFLNSITKNLLDEETLISKAREHGVYAILAGHTHEPDDYSAGRERIRVICAGTASQNDLTEKQCQIIEVDKNFIGQPRVITKEYLIDRENSTFAPK